MLGFFYVFMLYVAWKKEDFLGNLHILSCFVNLLCVLEQKTEPEKKEENELCCYYSFVTIHCLLLCFDEWIFLITFQFVTLTITVTHLFLI